MHAPVQQMESHTGSGAGTLCTEGSTPHHSDQLFSCRATCPRLRRGTGMPCVLQVQPAITMPWEVRGDAKPRPPRMPAACASAGPLVLWRHAGREALLVPPRPPCYSFAAHAQGKRARRCRAALALASPEDSLRTPPASTLVARSALLATLALPRLGAMSRLSALSAGLAAPAHSASLSLVSVPAQPSASGHESQQAGKAASRQVLGVAGRLPTAVAHSADLDQGSKAVQCQA